MAPHTWSSTKTKVQLKLSVQRLRGLQEKKSAQAKSARRDIAGLLEIGKVEKARVKVENIINEDIYIELLELLELYCEVLIARFGLLDQNTREPDPNIIEAVCCVIHAAPRTELKELHILRELLMVKYGRDFAIKVMENHGNCVGDRVMKKLSFGTPSAELVDAYLTEIARGYNISWTPPPKGSDDGDGDGSLKEPAPQPITDIALTVTKDSIAESATSPPSTKPSSPMPKAATAGSTSETDIVKPSIPDLPHTASEENTLPGIKDLRNAPPVKPNEDDEFKALESRFAALKRRGGGL